VVVARFLALLELYKEGVLLFEQLSALGELHIRWTGSDEGEVAVTDEFDEVYVPEDEGLKDE
jgi:segregation and condensation protein A